MLRRNICMSEKKRVGFMCVHNSCRSQMAEGFAKALGADVMDPVSGGTDTASEVDPLAIAVMAEVSIDISGSMPKRLPPAVAYSLDLVVSMGCGPPDVCPYIPGIPNEDWGIEDPKGKGIETYRRVRGIIRGKVVELVERLRSGRV